MIFRRRYCYVEKRFSVNLLHVPRVHVERIIFLSLLLLLLLLLYNTRGLLYDVFLLSFISKQCAFSGWSFSLFDFAGDNFRAFYAPPTFGGGRKSPSRDSSEILTGFPCNRRTEIWKNDSKNVYGNVFRDKTRSFVRSRTGGVRVTREISGETQ